MTMSIKSIYMFVILIMFSYQVQAQESLSSEKPMAEDMFDLYIEDGYILPANPSDTYNPNCSLLDLFFRSGKTKPLVSVAFRIHSKDLKKVLFQSIYTLRHTENEGVSICVDPEYLDSAQLIFTIRSGVEVPGALKNHFRSYQSFIYKDLHEKIKSL